MVDLIRWPEAAKVDRIIPKERLYSAANARSALKQRFVDQVQRARWAYKLGEESLRLAPGMFVTEIQVVVVDLKGPNLDNSVLAGIDRAIPSHLVFELRREDGLWVEQAMAAAHTFAGGKTKAADYFRSGWIGSDRSRIPLPAALDMDGLYSQLLGRLLPHPMRAGETLSDALERMGHIRRLTREMAALEKRLHGEAQLNRRLEIHRKLKESALAMTELTRPQPNIKD